MKLYELAKTISEHSGEFLCEQIHDENQTRVIYFRHIVTPAEDSQELPTVGRLRDFYETFGSVLFYFDEQSGDAGKYIAPTSEWDELQDNFNDWFDDLEEEERSEILPDWIDDCLVIGETPHSGNYILMVAKGAVAGQIFEFEHDGFEFLPQANDLVEYVEKLLKPDAVTLTEIASHMRFAEGDRMIQWWIKELRDNRGNIVKTRT